MVIDMPPLSLLEHIPEQPFNLLDHLFLVHPRGPVQLDPHEDLVAVLSVNSLPELAHVSRLAQIGKSRLPRAVQHVE